MKPVRGHRAFLDASFRLYPIQLELPPPMNGRVLCVAGARRLVRLQYEAGAVYCRERHDPTHGWRLTGLSRSLERSVDWLLAGISEENRRNPLT